MSTQPPQEQDQDGDTLKLKSNVPRFEPTGASQIRSLLEERPQGEKWGWVIYRCCYKPELEDTWLAFKRAVVEVESWCVAQSDAPEILKQMDWVFVEDPTLESASRDELKRKFKSWVLNDSGLSSAARDTSENRGSRYSIFIYVDEEALQSLRGYGGKGKTPGQIIALGEEDFSQQRHIKMVRAWYDDPEPEPNDGYDPAYPPDSEEWMKICPRLLSTWFYIYFEEDQDWYVYFTCPPEICRS